MRILSIETSCDETACAVVDGTTEVVSTLATSKEFHDSTGGIVPEIAARKQVEYIVPVLYDVVSKLRRALNIDQNVPDMKVLKETIDTIAVTIGPGLIGSLIVGIEAAKTLSLVLNKPLIPVNHLVGHIYANYLTNDNNSSAKDIPFPFIGLVVSGGHTDLILAKDHYDFEYIGGTLDDAAGEAFDKAARMLGISMYMGGAELSSIAQDCKKNIYKNTLPRPMLHTDDFDFSFSGLKTSVKRFIEKTDNLNVCCIAKDFESSIVEVLVKKTVSACEKFNVKTVLLGGGVSANKKLRNDLKTICDEKNIALFYPPLNMCGDNAVYIGIAAYYLQKAKGFTIFEHPDYSKIKPVPSLGIMDNAI